MYIYICVYISVYIYLCIYISADFLFSKFGSSKCFIIQYFSIKQSLHDNGNRPLNTIIDIILF